MEKLPVAQAVEALVRDYSKLVFHTLYGLTSDWEESQDLTQEVFLHALRSLDAARDASGPHFHARAWLLRIALNQVRMRQRRRALVQFIPFSQLSYDQREWETRGEEEVQEHAAPVQPAGYGASVPPDPAVIVPERDAVQRALASLPDILRTPLLLSIVGGCSPHEIAVILDIREDAARQRLSRARKAFQARYTVESGEPLRETKVETEPGKRVAGRRRQPMMAKSSAVM